MASGTAPFRYQWQPVTLPSEAESAFYRIAGE